MILNLGHGLGDPLAPRSRCVCVSDLMRVDADATTRCRYGRPAGLTRCGRAGVGSGGLLASRRRSCRSSTCWCGGLGAGFGFRVARDRRLAHPSVVGSPDRLPRSRSTGGVGRRAPPWTAVTAPVAARARMSRRMVSVDTPRAVASSPTRACPALVTVQPPGSGPGRVRVASDSRVVAAPPGPGPDWSSFGGGRHSQPPPPARSSACCDRAILA